MSGSCTLLNSIRILAVALFVAATSGCASSGPIGQSPAVQVADLTSLPAPSASDYVVGGETNLVRPLDRLRIEVFDVPQLSRETQVGAAGTFSYPLIGTVEANGRTPAEIAREIENRLRGPYVLEPEVTAEIIERTGQSFTIGGEVDKPGRYAIATPTTLLEAVAIGGGTSEFAKLDDVLVFRTVNGQRYIGAFNLAAIERGNYDDPPVYAKDIIVVGDSPNRRRLQTIIGLAPLITTPIFLLERLVR